MQVLQLGVCGPCTGGVEMTEGPPSEPSLEARPLIRRNSRRRHSIYTRAWWVINLMYDPGMPPRCVQNMPVP